MIGSKTALGLKSTVMVLEMSLLTWLIFTEELRPVAFLLLIIVGAIAIVVVVRRDWPNGALLVILIASAMPRFSATIGTAHVRPEHVAIALVSLASISLFKKHRILLATKMQVGDYLLIGFVA